MSKSIQDYRNIIKVLKLQLLKVRQENSTMSHSLGITSQTQSSSFTPRINKCKESKHPFARKMLLVTNFAHRCQIIGITPQMIFRITDKKRDKKVSVNSLMEIMKRLKLKMDDIQISELCGLLTKSGQLHYEQYLQFVCAFQINSEKYPQKSQRTFTQLCLIKFGQQCLVKKFSVEQLYKIMNKNENPGLTLQDFSTFILKNDIKLKEIQVVGIFVGLDIQTECEVQREVFEREMGKVFSLVERGVTVDYENDPDNHQDEEIVKIKGRKPVKVKDEEEQMEIAEDTGVQNINKNVKKPAKKPVPADQIKLGKGEYAKLIGELKKQNIRVQDLINKLLQSQEKKLLVRPFSLLQFYNSIKKINQTFSKKKAFEYFKNLDTQNNGSISSEQILKLWLRSIQVTSSIQLMYKILYRHCREIQFNDPEALFTNLGFDKNQKLSQKILREGFIGLNLSNQESRSIMSSIGQTTIQKFAIILKNQGKKKGNKVFKPLSKGEYSSLNEIIKKVIGKNKESRNFKKLMRLQNQGKDYWETIFSDQWKCWQYCLQTAKELTKFWRDPEFGPTKGDPHGYRSIVGNQSNVPPGLPDQQQIQWLTFEELLVKQKNTNDQCILMGDNIKTTDVVQGKLGDCWLVSSLSIIANDDTYIKGKSIKNCRRNPEQLTFGVYPLLFQYFSRFGLYVFKFYKQFKPIYVIVDDLFPVQSSMQELIFAKSPNPGLQWVAFLEKAYAKLHHTYSNLISGDISQGLNDLTNSLPIKWSLDPENHEWMDKLFKLNRQKQLMGCSISAPKGTGVQKPVQLDGQRCGLFYGHAYSISDMIHLKTEDSNEFDLIRLRNPWGHGEWTLDWSEKPIDDDPQYGKLDKYMDDIKSYYEKRIKEAEKALEEKPEMYERKDDGQFLMNFEDWLKVYTNIFIGFSFKDQPYSCQYIVDKWDTETPSGICKLKNASDKQQKDFVKNNHQYILDLKKPTDILMMYIQQDGRLYRGEKYPYKQLCNGVIILVFRLQKNQSQLQAFNKEKLVTETLKLQIRRQVDFWSTLQPGKYAVIPCKMKNDIIQSSYQFRVYSNNDVDIKKIKNKKQSFKQLQTVIKDKPDQIAIHSLLDVIEKSMKQ